MAKSKFSKWDDKIDPNQHISITAAHHLKHRSAAVQYYLKLATKHRYEDIEYIHQLRVWSRRCNESLRFFRGIFPRKKNKTLGRMFRTIRRAANNARDLDVLIEKYKHASITIENPRFLHFLLKERELSQLSVQEIYFLLKKGKLLKKQLNVTNKALIRSYTKSKKNQHIEFKFLAAQNIERLSNQFFDSMLLSHTKPSELHETRIHGKRLRYAIELSKPVLPVQARKEAYSTLITILDVYGSFNDSHVFQEHLKNWIHSSNDAELIYLFQELYYKENSEKINTMQQLNKLNSSENVYALREKINALITYNKLKRVA